jgi:hypothetical protein
MQINQKVDAIKEISHFSNICEIKLNLLQQIRDKVCMLFTLIIKKMLSYHYDRSLVTSTNVAKIVQTEEVDSGETTSTSKVWKFKIGLSIRLFDNVTNITDELAKFVKCSCV